MKLTVEHQLNAHFVDADSAVTESFQHGLVLVTLATHKAKETDFASVNCSGVIDVGQPVDKEPLELDDVLIAGDHRFSLGFPFLVPTEIDARWFPHLATAYRQIETLLEEVGALVRWRFNLSGQDSVFKSTSVMLETERGQPVELRHIAPAAMGDDRAAIDGDGLSEVADMLALGMEEPLAHRLWREAWNLRFTNPRGSLVIGVTAAEVGLKQTIATLVPLSRWLVEELPSPPLVQIIKNYLPELPVRAEVERTRRCPKHLRSLLDVAVKERNAAVHRGITPKVDLRETLMAVREFLYLLDLYEGKEWAVAKLSRQTIEALGIANPLNS